MTHESKLKKININCMTNSWLMMITSEREWRSEVFRGTWGKYEYEQPDPPDPPRPVLPRPTPYD